ncbi:MscS Small-conductance mechanosensitive channel [Burkholderiaceae bacterium]|jgi:CRP-like cAMP-binding protein/small-conductance mechanosensitive channel
MSVPNFRIFLLPKALLWLVIALNFGLMFLLDKLAGSPWSWHASDFEKESMNLLVDGLAIFQFVLLAFTIDQIMRFGVVRHNKHTEKTHVPAIIIQLISVLIYSVFALVAYVLLYDHNFTHLLASIGALSVGLAYIFRDLIGEVVSSITIQADRLVSIDDWIEVSHDGATEYFQVKEIDYRMVVLKNSKGLVKRIHNQKFLALNYINLSKQEAGVWSRRKFEYQLTARNNPERILAIMELALTHVIANNPEFKPWHSCRLAGLQEGAITYLIKYECLPSLVTWRAQSIILLCFVRFFKAAGVNLNRLEAQHPLENFTDTENRLLDSYDLGILKLLSNDEISTLAKAIKTKYCYAGQPIIQKGAEEDWMYIISEGTLEVKIPDKSGELKVVATLWPGDFVGEMSMLTGAVRSADVFAKTNAILLEVSKENIAPLLDSNPDLVKQFSDVLAQRQAQNETFATQDGKDNTIITASKSITAKILQFFLKKK